MFSVDVGGDRTTGVRHLGKDLETCRFRSQSGSRSTTSIDTYHGLRENQQNNHSFVFHRALPHLLHPLSLNLRNPNPLMASNALSTLRPTVLNFLTFNDDP
ncbi:unnamed protein product [Spodoptera exigua]|nr:unnamed protein product [Spodoptera exigua]